MLMFGSAMRKCFEADMNDLTVVAEAGAEER